MGDDINRALPELRGEGTEVGEGGSAEEGVPGEGAILLVEGVRGGAPAGALAAKAADELLCAVQLHRAQLDLLLQLVLLVYSAQAPSAELDAVCWMFGVALRHAALMGGLRWNPIMKGRNGVWDQWAEHAAKEEYGPQMGGDSTDMHTQGQGRQWPTSGPAYAVRQNCESSWTTAQKR